MGLLGNAWGYAYASWYLRRRGVEVGRRPFFEGLAPIIRADGRITVGDTFRVRASQTPVELGAGPGGELLFGTECAMNSGVSVYAAERIEFGNNVMLGDYVGVFDTDWHEVEEGAGVRVAPITVGSNVWITRGALVLPGVTIGDNAVVAAGAVVIESVPANTLVAGMPARVIREIRASPGWVREPFSWRTELSRRHSIVQGQARRGSHEGNEASQLPDPRPAARHDPTDAG